MPTSTSILADRILLVAAGSQMEAAVTAAVDPNLDLTVASDAEAVGRLHSHDIDALIVTDDLASTDPSTLIKQIRREFPTLPLVCISGSESGVLASDLLAAGADDYIPLSVVSTDPDRLQSACSDSPAARNGRPRRNRSG